MPAEQSLSEGVNPEDLRLMFFAIALLDASPQGPPSLASPCPSQPMPPAIESAGEQPIASETIEFSAAPSLEYSGRAWVVRLSRRGDVAARVKIVRLRRELDCNRWDIEGHWQAALSQNAYAALAAEIVPLGIPKSDVFIPSTHMPVPELATDGTGIELRLRSAGWIVYKAVNASGVTGAQISTTFRNLVAKLVPANELPSRDWRTR